MIRAALFSVRIRSGIGVFDRTAAGRGGMTLVELMVTLVIISILTSLSMAGLAVARNSARKAKTESTIRKLSEIIIPYYEQYETRRPAITNSSKIAALTNGRASLTDAKQTAIRRLMTLELPERAGDFRDAFTTASGTFLPIPYTLTYGAVTATLADTPPSARRYYSLTNALVTAGGQPTSSELLHLIVTRGPVADPDITAHFRDDEVRDLNGNGLPEFVDGWGKPIAFRRWPVGFASPMQPIDGTLRTIESLVSTKGHRLVPLIFSAGTDGAYDIESLGAYDASASPTAPQPPAFSYAAQLFDPFVMATSAAGCVPLGIAPGASTIAGSVVLAPTTLTSGGVAGPLVFTATRISSPSALPSGAFLTVGSETDTGSPDDEAKPDGALQSRDNITNHDMTR